MTITIKQGDSDTLTETITGLSTLLGYTAKLYIETPAGVEIDTITGTISSLIITYQIVNEDSKAYTLGRNKYETKIFDTSDHVYTTSSGYFIVNEALENDPT